MSGGVIIYAKKRLNRYIIFIYKLFTAGQIYSNEFAACYILHNKALESFFYFCKAFGTRAHECFPADSTRLYL